MKHTGSCHCGKVTFEAEVDSLNKGMVCNCSICLKRGSILEFIPQTDFRLLSGSSELTEYTFNQHTIKHQFCKTCGILPFAYGQLPDGKKMTALNLRCIDGIEIDKLKIMTHDGKHA